MLLLEREPFPRYHIGESLIPYTWFTLNRLGVVDWLQQVGVPEEVQRAVRLDHRQGLAAVLLLPDDQARVLADLAGVARRVRRDAARQRARRRASRSARACTVRDVLMDGTRVVGVRADAKDGAKGQEIRAKVVVDATGRDSLLSRKFGWKDRDADLNKIAVWSYFKGAKRDPGLDEGATTVAYVPQKGWFWYIPLHSDIVSVGVVGEPGYLYRDTRDPDAIFHREVEACAWIRDHISVGAAGASRCASPASTRITRSASAATASAWSATRSRSSIRSSRPASSSRSRAARWRPTRFTRRSGRRATSRRRTSTRYYEQQRHAVMSFRRLVLRLLRPDVQLPRVPAGLPAPALAHRRHARRQRVHRSDAALHRARGVRSAARRSSATREIGRRADGMTLRHRCAIRATVLSAAAASSSTRPTWPASSTSAGIFRYMEEAEHALWRAAGLSIVADRIDDIGFPRVAAPVEFHGAAALRGRVRGARSRRGRERGARSGTSTTITRGETKIATGTITAVCVAKDADGRCAAIDDPGRHRRRRFAVSDVGLKRSASHPALAYDSAPCPRLTPRPVADLRRSPRSASRSTSTSS